MRRSAIVSGFIAAICLIPAATCQEFRPWWVAGELGEGQFTLSSDQVQGKRDSTFALGFAGGRQLGSRFRAGLHVNGWLLQAFNLNDPTVGESVTNVTGVIDVFPLRNSYRLFARGGLGHATYSVNRPSGVSGGGLAWEAGAGYEIPLRGQFSLVPMVEYSAGHLGDIHIPNDAETGRKFSVVGFKISVIYHFGRPRLSMR